MFPSPTYPIPKTVLSYGFFTVPLWKFDIVTFFFGKDVNEENQNQIIEEITNKFPQLECYSVFGGQETFDIIIVME